MKAYEILTQNLEDILAIIKDHSHLLDRLNEGNDPLVLHQCALKCPHKQKLKETLLETIQVLEETKKTFKSKQIELLRKKLIGILAETDQL